VEAIKLKTVADLELVEDERVEVINGEIVRRPMARSEHALLQSGLVAEMGALPRRQAPGGWWIMTEIGVRYGEHQCPTHDIAGWRKERVPGRPSGIMQLLPDWVCEISSPGHERKDVFQNFMLLQRARVAYYWVVSPEDRTLIAYRLVDGNYHVVFSIECHIGSECGKSRIPPFDEIEFDLAYLLGADQ
jgi:Uma2 family endonuclease